MSRRKAAPPMPPTPIPADGFPPMTLGEQIHVAVTGRRQRILEARSRTPVPTYEEIAREVGCCVKTVYNVIKLANG